MISDSDIKNVLGDDGVSKHALQTFHDYENSTAVNIDDLRDKTGLGKLGIENCI